MMRIMSHSQWSLCGLYLALSSMNCKHIYIYINIYIYIYVHTLISYILYIYIYIYYTHYINHRLTQILDASVDQKSRHD